MEYHLSSYHDVNSDSELESLDRSTSQENVLVVEGGAMRSAFAAGVLDAFLTVDFNPFDVCVGTSAGALNLVGYLGKGSGQGLRVLIEDALDKRFISYRRYLAGGHLMDIDWLIARAFNRFGSTFDRAVRQNRPLLVGVTELASGDGHLIRANPDNIKPLLTASMALPVIYKGFPQIDARAMTDGGVGLSIPLQQVIDRGAKNIMVIRSHHQSYRKIDSFGHKFIRWRLRQYPQLCAALEQRVQKYEHYMALLANPPCGVQIIEVCPEPSFDMGRFERNPKCVLQGYYAGKKKARGAISKWNTWVDGSSPRLRNTGS